MFLELYIIRFLYVSHLSWRWTYNYCPFTYHKIPTMPLLWLDITKFKWVVKFLDKALIFIIFTVKQNMKGKWTKWSSKKKRIWKDERSFTEEVNVRSKRWLFLAWLFAKEISMPTQWVWLVQSERMVFLSYLDKTLCYKKKKKKKNPLANNKITETLYYWYFGVKINAQQQ